MYRSAFVFSVLLPLVAAWDDLVSHSYAITLLPSSVQSPVLHLFLLGHASARGQEWHSSSLPLRAGRKHPDRAVRAAWPSTAASCTIPIVVCEPTVLG
jgi:hypothetical protein